jgi:hypothetical protein
MNKTVVLLVSLLVIAYGLTLKGVYGNLSPNGTGSEKIAINKPPFETSMERGRYAQVVSVAESGNFDVNEFYKFLKPDLAWYNGNFLSTFPVGTALLAVPLYLVGKWAGIAQVLTFASSAVFSILTAMVIFKINKKLGLGDKPAAFGSIMYGLASGAWAYSVSLSAHPISALVVACGMWLFLKLEENPQALIHYLGLGFLLSTGLFIDYPNLAIFLPLIVMALWGRIVKLVRTSDFTELQIKGFRPLMASLAGFAILLTVFVFYNLRYYQKPIAFANSYTIKFLETKGIDFESVNLTNDIFEGRDYSKRFDLDDAGVGAGILLFSHDRGLFFYFPIFLLSLGGVVILWRKNTKLAIVMLSVILVNLFFYGSYDDPWGGWSFGPRYLIASLPLLSIFGSVGYDFLNNKYGVKMRYIVIALLLFSVGIALLGALTTNAVPPSIESEAAGLPDNFVYNWQYLHNNGTSSFVHNTFLSQVQPLVYALYVFTLVAFTLSLLIL